MKLGLVVVMLTGVLCGERYGRMSCGRINCGRPARFPRPQPRTFEPSTKLMSMNDLLKMVQTAQTTADERRSAAKQLAQMKKIVAGYARNT